MAEQAAGAAGVKLLPLENMDRIRQAADLFTAVWHVPRSDGLIPANTLRAIAHSGNYVFGAYEGKRLLGGIVGFLGRSGGRLQLHSHILGVSDAAQGRSVGFALKQHQRAWALEQGLDLVNWTFDPLVRRNAYFNVAKLGATISAYFPNFYGLMNDGINDEESDRVLVEWHLGDANVVAASEGRARRPDEHSLENEGAVVVLEEDSHGAPLTGGDRGRILLASVPEDIVQLRARGGDLAGRWRSALRDILGGALGEGYLVAGMTRSGSYVLRAPEKQ